MQYTKILELKKPENTDNVNIDDINYNSDKIDESMDANAKAILANTKTITQHTQAISQNTTAIAQTDQNLGSHTASQVTHLHTLTHSKSSTVHTLTGIPTTSGIYTAQFKAVSDYLQGDSFNGYTAKPVGEDTAMPNKAFVTGDLVTIVVDTQSKKLGFKLGGGGVNDTLPSQVKNLTATAGNAKVTLSWTNPTTGFAGLVIMRKVGSQPIGVTDGTKVYEGTGASFIDTTVTNGTTYYYRAFPYNAKKQYQTDIVGAVVSAKPLAYDPILANNTWARINEAAQAGVAQELWRVGDTKDITLTTGEVLTMQIYGFNHDDLTSGGKAKITFGMKNLMNSAQKMNNGATTSGGFIGSALYSWMKSTLYNSLPSDLSIIIKSVNKQISASVVAMQIFLFSEYECLGITSQFPTAEGKKYDIFTDNASRSKGNFWWLRSITTNQSGAFCLVDTSGYVSYYLAGNSASVCFGFCI